jgi:hypothetical protein
MLSRCLEAGAILRKVARFCRNVLKKDFKISLKSTFSKEKLERRLEMSRGA